MKLRDKVKLLLVIMGSILLYHCFVQATGVLKKTYFAAGQYDQRNEQDFRDDISRRLQQLEEGK